MKTQKTDTVQLEYFNILNGCMMVETALLRDCYHELLINCFDFLLYNKPVLVNLAKYHSNGKLQKLKLIQ